MKTRKMLSLFLCCLMAAGLMAGCGGSGSGAASASAAPASSAAPVEAAPKIREHLNIGVVGSPASFDTQDVTDNPSLLCNKMIYNTLAFFDELTGETKPCLAESWELNGNAITFKLRKGVKFHDGSDCDAKDVVYSLQRAMTKKGGASRTANFDRIEAADDYTVNVVLKAASPVYINDFVHISMGIVPEGAGKIPQGLEKQPFETASKLIRDTVGDISDDIVVQGSRAAGTARANSDIDFAIRVSKEQFDTLIKQYFKTPNPGTAAERTLLRAIQSGKIQAGEARLSGLRKMLEKQFAMNVDISIILKDGPFDNGTIIKLP